MRNITLIYDNTKPQQLQDIRQYLIQCLQQSHQDYIHHITDIQQYSFSFVDISTDYKKPFYVYICKSVIYIDCIQLFNRSIHTVHLLFKYLHQYSHSQQLYNTNATSNNLKITTEPILILNNYDYIKTEQRNVLNSQLQLYQWLFKMKQSNFQLKQIPTLNCCVLLKYMNYASLMDFQYDIQYIHTDETNNINVMREKHNIKLNSISISLVDIIKEITKSHNYKKHIHLIRNIIKEYNSIFFDYAELIHNIQERILNIFEPEKQIIASQQFIKLQTELYTSLHNIHSKNNTIHLEHYICSLVDILQKV